jgi:hypothetical protein
MVCLAATAVLLTTLAAEKVLRGSFIALPAALTVGFILFGGLDATHHWFSALLAIIAMLVLFRGSQNWRVVLAGSLCGIVASFTQSRGATVTVGFLVYLLWQSFDEKQKATVPWRRCMLLCGAALLTFLAINGPYIAALGIKEWIKWVIVFPFRYYPSLPAQTWRSPLDDFRNQTGFIRWICIPFLYVTVPLVYFVFLRVMYLRRRLEPDQPWNQLLLLAITGLAMFLAVAPCLSVMRVSSASLPAWSSSRGFCIEGKGREEPQPERSPPCRSPSPSTCRYAIRQCTGTTSIFPQAEPPFSIQTDTRSIAGWRRTPARTNVLRHGTTCASIMAADASTHLRADSVCL